jgi:putative CocE/NonD family hydrolase
MSVFHAAGVEVRTDVKVPMRDGARLSADLYIPRGQAGPFPAILSRTPYDNTTQNDLGYYFAQHGYVYVAQDTRGRYDSEGEFTPWVNEAADGHDTVEWIGRQPWCNGNVGTQGGSYLGFVQWAAATGGSQFLKCIAPRIIGDSLYDDLYYPGGALHLSFFLHWQLRMTGRSNQNLGIYNFSELYRTLPLQQLPKLVGKESSSHLSQFLEHPSYDAFWKKMSIKDQYNRVKAPVLHLNGWYDYFAGGTAHAYAGMRAHGGSETARLNQKMVFGPWYHGGNLRTNAGEADFGFDALVEPRAQELRWFNRWLKGERNGIDTERPVRLFLMGANGWREENDWPVPGTQPTAYYLHSRGRANTFRGDGALSTQKPTSDEPADGYAYDPLDPVPTLGGNGYGPQAAVGAHTFGPQFSGGYDQRPVEGRQDVLVYSTEPLERDVEVTGPVSLVLYAASDATDTDFTAKLVDVHPGGYAVNVCDGIIRARYRQSRSEAKLLTPGRVEQYTVDLWVTGNVFKKGHRIRLEVSSSNFPHFDRNPNTGHDFGVDAEVRIARQEVHHNAQHPSHLVLPIVPRS